MLDLRRDRIMELLMRLTPIALTVAIALATMASAGQGQKPDDQIDARSVALTQQGQALAAQARYQEATDLLEIGARPRSAQPPGLYRPRQGGAGAEAPRQGDQILFRGAEARAQRRRRPRRPGRGPGPARSGRARQEESRADQDFVRQSLPAGDPARRRHRQGPAARSDDRAAARGRGAEALIRRRHPGERSRDLRRGSGTR